MEKINEIIFEYFLLPTAMVAYTVCMAQLACSIYQDWRKKTNHPDEPKD